MDVHGGGGVCFFFFSPNTLDPRITVEDLHPSRANQIASRFRSRSEAGNFYQCDVLVYKQPHFFHHGCCHGSYWEVIDRRLRPWWPGVSRTGGIGVRPPVRPYFLSAMIAGAVGPSLCRFFYQRYHDICERRASMNAVRRALISIGKVIFLPASAAPQSESLFADRLAGWGFCYTTVGVACGDQRVRGGLPCRDGEVLTENYGPGRPTQAGVVKRRRGTQPTRFWRVRGHASCEAEGTYGCQSARPDLLAKLRRPFGALHYDDRKAVAASDRRGGTERARQTPSTNELSFQQIPIALAPTDGGGFFLSPPFFWPTPALANNNRPFPISSGGGQYPT